MTAVHLRAERAADRTAVYRLTAAAFGREDEARLVEALRADGDVVISLVAEIERRIVGHVLLSRLENPARCLALAPVCVMPGRQGEGIGSALIREALERARAQGFAAVFVLGEPAYYTRFGFVPAAPFETEYPRAYFMALALTDALEAKGGPVVYPAAFAA